MSRYRSLFSWLMLPLLALGSLAALAEPLDGAAQALHMLGYIGADYPATVADGQVVDAGEYREQLEFIGVLQGLVVALPAKAERAELEQGIAALKHKSPLGIRSRVLRALETGNSMTLMELSRAMAMW